jgi:beta-lactamase regulating signal transducer with metallopeptidase domain
MKTIYALGKGKFVTMDSYQSKSSNKLADIFIALLSLLIAAITAGALVGVDITTPSTQTHHVDTNCPGY